MRREKATRHKKSRLVHSVPIPRGIETVGQLESAYEDAKEEGNRRAPSRFTADFCRLL